MRVRRGTGVLAPLGLGDHVDHLAVYQAASRAIPSNRLAFYEDLPYATWTTEDVLEKKIASTQELAGISLRPALIRIPNAAFRKRRVIKGYRSQIRPEDADAIARWSSNFGGGERIWVPRYSRYWARSAPWIAGL